MFIISNNCCGGWVYKLCGYQFNNPFIWMICPLQSIYYMMNNLAEIQWDKFTIEPSELKEHTYKINVDNLIQIHYVHYVFNQKKQTLSDKMSYNRNIPIQDNEIEYCRIWEYVVQKYVDRVKRMILLHEPPIFLLMDHMTSIDEMTAHEIMRYQCQYKRVLLTSAPSNTYTNSDYVIPVNINSNPMQIITTHLSKIKHIVLSE